LTFKFSLFTLTRGEDPSKGKIGWGGKKCEAVTGLFVLK